MKHLESGSEGIFDSTPPYSPLIAYSFSEQLSILMRITTIMCTHFVTAATLVSLQSTKAHSIQKSVF